MSAKADKLFLYNAGGLNNLYVAYQITIKMIDYYFALNNFFFKKKFCLYGD